jgi:CheY-like chemotaxis protein/anti-sigma regulatory factor (Ser/Thr protein kinase)
MPTALVVDDSPVDGHRVSSLLEKLHGWKATQAADGREALAAIGRQLPDVILTDLRMPGMDGLALVEEVKRKYPSVPVLVMTAFGSEDIAILALERGAAGYVPKRDLSRHLARIVAHVLEVAQASSGHRRVLGALTHGESHFVLDNDLTLVPHLAGHLRDNLIGMKLCDENEAIRVGVALREALENAILHGNLEVKTETRGGREMCPPPVRGEQAHHDLVAERCRQPPYCDRRVYLRVKESPTEAVYVIRDEGPGFDPNQLPDARNPAHLEQFPERGLRLIRTFMDEVRHNSAGNEITLVKRRRG